MTPRHRLLPATFLLVLFLLVGPAAAANYQWRDVQQEVTVREDGTIVVDDVRTLWTDEDFGEAFICLHLTPGQSVTLLPGSGALGPGPDSTAYTQPCADGGTELVVRNSRRVSQRRVRFHYELVGAVDVYRDVVQWYWQILETDHPGVRGYQLTVTTPGPTAEPYDAYVHRFGNREEPRVRLDRAAGTLAVSFDRVPSGDGVEVRYLMDPALFIPKGARDGFERLLLDEAKVAGVQTWQQARRSPYWGILPLSLIGLMGTGVMLQYGRVGREPRTVTMRHPFEPPTDLPPAAVSSILTQWYSQAAMGPAFHATIMDLMRRGFGEFELTSGKKFNIRLHAAKPRDGLLPFEADVLGYLTRAAGKSPELLTHSELKNYSQRHASSFMSRWGKTVRDWLLQERGGELTTAASRAAANKFAGLSLLAALVPGGMAFLLDKGAMAMMIVGAGLLVGLAIVARTALPSWRPEIAQEVAEWRGFKRTLSDYTRMKDAPLDFFKLWDVYYAYAAALGVADAYLKALSKAAPLAGADEQSMVRTAAWMGITGNNAALTSFSGLSSSISSLSSALSSASASASSGGSSPGGGGGGGGGSSGGR